MLSVCCVNILASLLGLLVLLRQQVTSGASLPQESPLHKVFHRDLFTRHGLSPEHTTRLSHRHFHQSLHGNATAPILLLGCGPTFPERHPQASTSAHEARDGGSLSMEYQLRKVLGPGRVHVAGVNHKLQEVCVVVQATPADVLMLDLPLTGAAQDSTSTVGDVRGEWQFDAVPFLLKIHQKVLALLAEEEPFPPARTSSWDPELSTGAALPAKGEHLELVVQFFAGVPFSQEDWQTLLQSWAGRDDASGTFQQQLTTSRAPSNTDPEEAEEMEMVESAWEVLLQKHPRGTSTVGAVGREDTSFSHCEVPPATSAEFHPADSDSVDGGASVAKLVDLSGWTGGASSTFCLMKLLEVLSVEGAVLSISVEPRPTLLNYDVRGILQSGAAASTPFSDARLLGEGQVVGVADSGLDDKSCFFWDNSNYYSSSYTTRNSGGSTLEVMRRKVVQYTSYADSYDSAAGHGTHVVGTIVGDSISYDFSRANGVAPGAKVAFYDVQRGAQAYLTMPSLASSLFPTLYRSGARVFSNSWGSAGSATYTDKCYDVDYYTYNNPDVLVIFAAGNSGADGTGSAFNPCSSKNSLCVGSIDSRNDGDDGVLSYNRVSYFSSQGPTGDGRIKPDVVGPGFKVVSALAGGQNGGDKFCGVYETFGTSMATPGVAGVALILRDYFLNAWSSVCPSQYTYCKSFVPTGYLLKAIIIHSGQAVRSYSESAFDSKTDIASHSLGSPPDSVQGYGSVNLNSIIPLSKQQREQHDLYISDAFGMGGRQTAKLRVAVTSNKKPLKVTLLWYDRPSTVGNTNNLLVVNLDLTVTSPSGTVHYGNGVNSDTTNPQEQIYISSPQKGTYTVGVTNVGSYAVYCAVVITCQGSVTQELAMAANTELDSSVMSVHENLRNTASSADITPTVSSRVDEGAANTAAADLKPLFSSFDLVKSFTIHHTLSPNEKVLLKAFELPDNSLELFSIELSLDAHYCSGSEAFIFAVIIEAPNGEMVQVGGYNEYATLDRLWQRMSPVQWTATSTPADGSSYWRTTRYVVDMELAQMGVYNVYVELMHDSWPSTTYRGHVNLNFVDAATALSRAKSSEGFFSGLGAVGAGLVIFVLAAVVVFVSSMVMRRRRAKKAAAEREASTSGLGGGKGMIALRKTKEKSRKGSKPLKAVVGSEEDAPWSNIASLLGDHKRESESAASGDVENPLQQPQPHEGYAITVDDKQAEVRHKRYKSARRKESSAHKE